MLSAPEAVEGRTLFARYHAPNVAFSRAAYREIEIDIIRYKLFIGINCAFTVRKNSPIPLSFGNRINCAAIPPSYVHAMVTVVSAPATTKVRQPRVHRES